MNSSIVLDAKHLFPFSPPPIYLFTKVHQFLSRIRQQRLAPITAGPLRDRLKDNTQPLTGHVQP